MLCLHYYSNYVTVRIQEDDEVYSLDQIKEFEDVFQPWSEVVAAYGEAGTTPVNTHPQQHGRRLRVVVVVVVVVSSIFFSFCPVLRTASSVILATRPSGGSLYHERGYASQVSNRAKPNSLLKTKRASEDFVSLAHFKPRPSPVHCLSTATLL